MRKTQKFGGPPYRRRAYSSMSVVLALMTVLAFDTGQPAWVLLGLVGPVVLVTDRVMHRPVGRLVGREVSQRSPRWQAHRAWIWQRR